ncbi:MAG: hypothetical protein Q7R53_01075 [bacterium]|nr:hypothetical protein [bacterium]
MEEKENNNQEENADKIPAEDASENPSPENEEEGQASAEMPLANFLTPEILMFIPAVLLDIIGLILLIFALDDFFITDIIGIAILGSWTYFRSQTLKVTKGASEKIGKAGKWAKKMKWLRPLLFVGELIPYVGALPCWTLLVFFELKG